jgi:excisionase family DNA binding protein
MSTHELQLPLLLRPAEAQQVLRVSYATLRRMIADGRLRAVQLGGPGDSLRIPRVELERILSTAEAIRGGLDDLDEGR